MIVPKKNTLRSITEKAEYLQKLKNIGVIAYSEFESAIEELCMMLKLPIRERILPGKVIHVDKPENIYNGGEAGIV